MQLALAYLIIFTIFVSIRNHGLLSFVTFGATGAAIYSVPGVVNLERPFLSFAHKEAFFSQPSSLANGVVLAAWAGLLVGVIAFAPRGGARPPLRQSEDLGMLPLAVASAIMATAGLFYLIYTQGASVFAAARAEQKTDAILVLWKWTAPLGLLASTSAKNRKLAIYHGLILFLIFLRGDRTLVAITAAIMLVTSAGYNRKWRQFLHPRWIIGGGVAVAAVFFGKSIYWSMKAGLSGEGFKSTGLTVKQQFLQQFEPLTTYSHLDFVINNNLHIPISKFLASVLSNFLVVPSLFGISTNLYTEMIAKTTSTQIKFGLAGNYVANGYAVGGRLGAVFFYFLLAFLLRLCDSKFCKAVGVWRLFWCCTGASLAFYVHRNGLDNMGSFVRQIAIVCLILSVTARILSPSATRGRSSRQGQGLTPSQSIRYSTAPLIKWATNPDANVTPPATPPKSSTE